MSSVPTVLVLFPCTAYTVVLFEGFLLSEGDGMVKNSAKFRKVFTNQIGMRFRWIPAGSFTMGDVGRQSLHDQSIREHEVFISSPYFLAQTPVTREQWTSVMGTSPWNEDGPDTGTPDYPATDVSYADAVAFCARMSASGKLKYGLPTEAQWERAAKADTDTDYSFDDEESQLGDYAWFKDNSGGYMHPVGTKKPNPWGLFDVHGLVLEWCSDDWSSRQTDQRIDPAVSNNDIRKTVKGGSWFANWYKCVSYYRFGMRGDWRLAHVGFRPLLEAAGVQRMLQKRNSGNRLAASKATR